MSTSDLKAPFPYMGGKSMVADLVWEALGNVTNYIEPFAGSAAVLLARPAPFKGTETINDANGYIANFWRAVSQDPDTVARHADHPVLENDLHARHRWLWERRDQLRAQLEADPDWCDPKIAGWWVWGMGTFFTGAWCVRTPHRCKPDCAGGVMARGIHGVTRDIHQWMRDLQARLRRVRVLCGDFTRALTPVVVQNTRPNEITGIFLDPPYTHEGRDGRCYGEDDDPDVFDKVIEWATANATPTVRIIVAGYDSRPMPEGWREVPWKASGGYGKRREGNENHHRERLWLSPHCVQPNTITSLDDLFGF